MMKRSPGEKVFTVFNVIILSFLGFICLLPMWHVLMASISDPHEVAISNGFILYPIGTINGEAYKIILNYRGVWNGYKNTIIYVVLSCLTTGFFSLLGGYVLSRRHFRYSWFFMILMMIPMLFSGGMIPTYMVIQKLKMLNTVWVMVIPGAISTFNFILMRIGMQNIPDSLEEAARIDGASEMRIIFHILLPLSIPIFAIIMLFTAVAKWNDYFTALLYLPQRNDLYPLQMYLKDILANATSVTSATKVVENASLYDHLVQYALIIVSSAPLLCIYPFIQKYFVKGIMLGGVKG